MARPSLSNFKGRSLEGRCKPYWREEVSKWISRLCTKSISACSAGCLAIAVDDLQDSGRQLMLLQLVPELHDRGVLGDRRAQGQACELAHRRDLVQRFLHRRVAERKSVLQQVNAQHGFQRVRLAPPACLWVVGLDQRHQPCTGHHLIHFDEKAFAAGLLALADVFEIGKAHLAYGGLSQWLGEGYFSTGWRVFGNLIGDSLNPKLFQWHKKTGGILAPVARVARALGK